MGYHYDLLDEGFLADPYPTYRRLREHDPAYYDPATNQWLVSRYADVHQLTRDPRLSSDRVAAMIDRASAEGEADLEVLRRLLTRRLFLTDPPGHTRIKALMNKAFTPARVNAMRPLVQAAVNELLDAARSGAPVDLIREFADPLPSRMITTILGIPRQDKDRLKAWTDEIYAFMAHAAIPLGERTRRGAQAAVEITAYLRNQLARHRTAPGDDLLDGLITAEEQGGVLSEEELIANVVGLINAGHETTTNLIGNGVWLLLKHPEQRRVLADDPALLPGAIEEVLRFESPIQIIARRTLAEIEVAGSRIPPDRNVALLLGAANRDPSQFDDPDRFNVARADHRHLAFGFGAHYCIGAALARLVGQVAIETLLRRWSHLALVPDSSPRWRRYPAFRGLERLPVVF
jgi:cytochrome P450